MQAVRSKRTPRQQMTLDQIRELVVDNFAGGGGASTGIARAIGRSVDIAINHDAAAIAMHKVNHPETKHFLESVWDVDPRKVTQGYPIGLAWFSPDCTHFSKAKGGKPVSKDIRGLAWVAVKWAALVRPRVLNLENVEEFKNWGPIDENGLPIKERKGETFAAFIACLSTGLAPEHPAWPEIREVIGDDFPYHLLEKGLGYDVDFRELRACDYGAPTIRKRLFLIARCDGRPIVWPWPTHGDPQSEAVKSGRLKPWRTAAEIIDWSIPCPSIFERQRPLAENTMRRIARGIKWFVMDNPNPFIIRLNYPQTSQRERMVDEPTQTLTAKNDLALVTPTLIQTGYGEREGQAPRSLDIHRPLGTVVAGGQKHALVAAFLLKYYGASDNGQTLSEPLHTVTARDRFGLVTIHGEDYQIVDIGMRMLEPRELFNAQGFPGDYIIDRDAEGNRFTKKDQVARCGNAVPPPFAEALVRANLPELCGNAPAAVASM